MKRLLAASMTALLLTACGGGNSGLPQPQPQAQSKAQATGSVVLSIPAGTAQSAARARYPQFVSPNANSVALSINGGTDTFFDVSPTSSLCTTVPGVGRNCTLSFGAPAGADSFAFLVFAGPNGTGATLASASKTQTISAGSPFSFSVALNPAIGTVFATVNGNDDDNNCQNTPSSQHQTIDEGCAGSGTLSITVEDPSGATVTGTDAFATPITITANDPSVTANPSTIANNGQTSTLSYSGATFGPSIASQVTISVTVGSVSIPVYVPVVRSYLYVANSNAQFGQTPAGGGNVAVYAFGANGTPTPVRTYSSGLSNPVHVVLDAAGDLYVLDNGPYTTHANPFINVYAPDSTTLLRSITNIAGDDYNFACESMVISPDGTKLVVSCDDNSTGTLHAFPTTWTGNVAASSLELYSWADDSSSAPIIGMVYDNAPTNLYVADTGFNTIDSYTFAGFPTVPNTPYQSIGANHSINGASIWTSGTQPVALLMDYSGTLYASISYLSPSAGAPDAGNEVALWKTTSIPCNNCAPTGTIQNIQFSNAHGLAGIALDPARNLYVSNPFTNQIDVIPSAQVSAAASTTVTSPSLLHVISTTASGSTAPTAIAVGP